MHFSMLLFPAIFLISFVLTMVGLGGGLIFSPLFVLLHFPKSMAVSASLFLNGIAAASAMMVYFRKKMVDLSISIPLIVTSSLAAPAGAFTTHLVNMEVFLTVMGAVLLLAGLRMFFSPAEREDIGATRGQKIVGGGLIGILIGFLAGLLGIGGGVFVVPLLIYLLKVPTKTAAASSIFIVFFSSLTGFVTHASIGGVDWRFVLIAALFSFGGGQAGSRIMAGRLKGRTVRIIFGVILIFMSAKLFHRAFL